MVHGPLQDPHVYTYLPEDPPSLEALQRRYDFLEGGRSPDGQEQWLNWVAFERGAERAVGTFQATLTDGAPGAIAYIIFTSHQRSGYGREMVSAMLDHLFRMNPIPSVYAEIDTRNQASIRLVESLGMTRVKTTIGADEFKGAVSDEYTYALDRDTWRSRVAGAP